MANPYEGDVLEVPRVTFQHWTQAIGGMFLGAAIGYAGFYLMFRFGLYMMIVPGALIGTATSRLSKVSSNAIGIVCAVFAAGVAVLMEWHFLPFMADDSLEFFIKNIADVNPMHLLMMAAGVALAFSFGRGREYSATRVQ